MKVLTNRSGRQLVLVLGILCLTMTISAQIRRGGSASWVILGTSHVDGNSDHDKIRCHGTDAYRALKFSVAGSAVQFDRINIVYGNHQGQTLPFQLRVAPGGTRTHDLPGGERDIDYIEFGIRRPRGALNPKFRFLDRAETA
jgi:hypothetical protein